MIVAVFKNEYLRLTRQISYWLLLVVFAALAGYATLSGWQSVESHNTGIQSIVNATKEVSQNRLSELVQAENGGQQASRGARLPYAQVEHMHLPFLDSAAVSVSKIEAYPLIARVTPITDTHAIFDEFAGSTSNPTVLAAGKFDLTFVIVLVFPLFIIALSYDLWTGERERGIAKQLMAEPVSFRMLIYVKSLAHFSLIVCPMSLIAGLCTLLMSSFCPMLWVLAICLLYGAFWLGLLIFINAITKRPTESAIASGVAWLSMVVLIPAILSVIVDFQTPKPSRAELANLTRASLLEAQNRGQSVLDAYLSQHPNATDELKVLSGGARQAFAVQLEADRLTSPIVEDFFTKEEARHKLSAILAYLSPSLIVQVSLDHLSGFSYERAVAFRQQTYKYLDDVRAYVTPFINEDKEFSAGDFIAAPRFEFVDVFKPAELKSQSIALLLYIFLFLGFFFLRSRRAKVD
ncbi:DUF3526 domain-containing protein [Glaciecola siphonariae]|uniref:DUF3526 domain-containing protein n=1 Tax=Glaciecola siphonariae TaxID=521012 RepID=A0ABV9LTK3_9ALTE